ncbi:alpha/beta fold hydrolase [Rhodococcus sp. NPDC059234]|uniref:alpha/beta fold hydrolase n=1 Tax=Rhodococcus sp. NPDC059234 TaxID=3346781 RepID=UPI00366F3294
METITTPAGIELAFDRYVGGDAGTVILIGGAFGERKFPKMVALAEQLADTYRLTVVNYDRRGRGDSTDTPGDYDVENEIDDIAALVEAVGGSASLFGWSSGAGLALLAAARVPGVRRVVAFEPPFVVDHENFVPAADLEVRLHELIAAGRRAETVKFYMTEAMGMPRYVTAIMRFTPMWKNLLATAPSTAHDWAVMGPYMRGTALDPAEWSSVTAPTLVISGEKSDALLRTGAAAIAAALPNATHRVVPKLSHNPNVELLAPVAGEFLTGTTNSVHPDREADR